MPETEKRRADREAFAGTLEGLDGQLGARLNPLELLRALQPAEKGLIAGTLASAPYLGLIPAAGGLAGGLLGYRAFSHAPWLKRTFRSPLITGGLGALLGFGIPELITRKVTENLPS